jgi:hypothetical protein
MTTFAACSFVVAPNNGPSYTHKDVGGARQAINTLDTACMIHDYCYFSGGFSALANIFGPANGDTAGLQQCNQALCDRAVAVVTTNPLGSEQSNNALQVIAYFTDPLLRAQGVGCKAE